MPVNVMDVHFRSFTNLVLPQLAKQNIGALAMKSMGGGVILKSKLVTPIECLHFAMSQPVSVVITGIESMADLDQAFEAVRTFQPMSKDQRSALLRRSAHAAADGQFELFKTTDHFDSTAKHPEWLGGETELTQRLASRFVEQPSRLQRRLSSRRVFESAERHAGPKAVVAGRRPAPRTSGGCYFRSDALGGRRS